MKKILYVSTFIAFVVTLSIQDPQALTANPPVAAQFVPDGKGGGEEMAKMQKCDACRGSGWMECYTCEGKGEYQDSKGKWRQCRRCEGTGKVRCDRCYGKGYIEHW